MGGQIDRPSLFNILLRFLFLLHQHFHQNHICNTQQLFYMCRLRAIEVCDFQYMCNYKYCQSIGHPVDRFQLYSKRRKSFLFDICCNCCMGSNVSNANVRIGYCKFSRAGNIGGRPCSSRIVIIRACLKGDDV